MLAICQKCAGFKSSYTCGCGESYMEHSTIVETKSEREARGIDQILYFQEKPTSPVSF